MVTNPSGFMQRYDQDTSWSGNFGPGATLLYNQGNGDLTITFATAIFGVGAQVQSNNFGSFTSTILVNGGVLGSFAATGSSSAAGDNSAIFHGVLSDTANITSITFQNLPNADFAIGNLALNRAQSGAVPEPSTWLSMIAGFGMLGGATRRRQKTSLRFAF